MFRTLFITSRLTIPLFTRQWTTLLRTLCYKNTNFIDNTGSYFLQFNSRKIHETSQLNKYNKKSSRDEDSDDEDELNEEFKDERDSKVIKTTVNSLRADLLLRAGLGMARNKVENHFYSSKIRVNGEKLSKKSELLDVGDEIDVVRGFSQSNPTHLVVSRVVVLSANTREEGYSVTLRRYKSLLIENYTGSNAYKSSQSADS